MRPRAALSGTLSLATAASIVPTRSSAAVMDRRSPPKAKQSSLSCAISGGRQTAMAENEPGNRWHVVEREDGNGEASQPRIAGNRHDTRIVLAQQRLAEARAMHFEFRVRLTFEAFDQHEIDGTHILEQC